MDRCCVIFCLLLCIVLLNADANIDTDYYFGSARSALRLRSNLDGGDCNSIMYQHLCIVGCPQNHVCFMKDCMCIDFGSKTRARTQFGNNNSKLEAQSPRNFVDLSKSYVRQQKLGYTRSKPIKPDDPVFVDLTMKRARPESSGDKRSELRELNSPPCFVDLTKMSVKKPEPYDDYYPPKSIGRHHIAHFCPNLDEARACIRKCMPLGKPAFCGKDHVCYCGHMYGKIISTDEADVKTMYAQFKDLYQKYFGNNHPGLPKSEEKEKSESEESVEILTSKKG